MKTCMDCGVEIRAVSLRCVPCAMSENGLRKKPLPVQEHALEAVVQRGTFTNESGTYSFERLERKSA